MNKEMYRFLSHFNTLSSKYSPQRFISTSSNLDRTLSNRLKSVDNLLDLEFDKINQSSDSKLLTQESLARFGNLHQPLLSSTVLPVSTTFSNSPDPNKPYDDDDDDDFFLFYFPLMCAFFVLFVSK